MSYEFSEDLLIEQTAIEIFERLCWQTAMAYDRETFGYSGTFGRTNKGEVVLRRYLRKALEDFNSGVPAAAYEQAVELLLAASALKSLAEVNHELYKLLREGVPVKFENEHRYQVTRRLRVFNFQEPNKNHFLAIRQLWIEGRSGRLRRPDIIGYINGLPLLFVELKAAHRDLRAAYDGNLSDYKDVIPHLFHHNAFVVLSNGIDSKIGAITAKYQHFHEWKRISENEEGIVSLETILVGVCEKGRFLDLFENFILFDTSPGTVVKLIARNHQFLGVNRAIATIKDKELAFDGGQISAEEKRKLGLFWHTQGSGKSYSMVFLAEKVHRTMAGSRTFLIATDRNELDDQIYGTFAGVGAIESAVEAKAPDESLAYTRLTTTDDSRPRGIRAEDGRHLKELLKTDNRYIFTLVQKFNFSEEITQRDNLIIISDEAHRTQGGKLALNMRKALPNASVIGFTGTPIFKGDQQTREIFGDYVSVYDFKRSIEDGATVPLHYENRGDLLKLTNPNITTDIHEAISQAELDEDQQAKVERLLARDYPILTAEARLSAIAKDVVWHFNNRGYQGKAMVVTLDKITAVRMYNLVQKHWYDYITAEEKRVANLTDQQEQLEQQRRIRYMRATEIAVVVSSEQGEVQKFKERGLDIDPHRLKINTRDLERDFKDEAHSFRLVIVCAMWLTGFDVPSLSTLYLDKPLHAHTLMQTIARANRVHEGKENGLIVDYIESYKSLLEALAIYGTGGRYGNEKISDPPVRPKEELLQELDEIIMTIEAYLRDDLDFNLSDLTEAPNGLAKLAALSRGVNAVSRNDETRRQFKILARQVFTKLKAATPDTRVAPFQKRVNALEVLYKKLEYTSETAGVSALMAQIQEIVDQSVENHILGNNEESFYAQGHVVNLSELNFDLVQRLFAKSQNRNIAVQTLKQIVAQKLQQMVQQNPTRVDFYQRYQEIIDEYNRGKDAIVIEQTFMELIALANALSEEEARIKREDLSPEEGAVFDLLRKESLTPAEKGQIKAIAKDLLIELKRDKLRVPLWYTKAATTAAVMTAIRDYLYDNLPYPTYSDEDIETRRSQVFTYFANQYQTGYMA